MADSVITGKAREKLAKARAGVIPLPHIIGMAFGDGGCSGNGDPLYPKTDGLYNEIFRKEIDLYQEVTPTCYKYVCTLTKEELADEKINEVALYDTDGDLVAIKTFRNKEKDSDMEMAFEINDQF